MVTGVTAAVAIAVDVDVSSAVGQRSSGRSGSHGVLNDCCCMYDDGVTGTLILSCSDLHSSSVFPPPICFVLQEVFFSPVCMCVCVLQRVSDS